MIRFLCSIPVINPKKKTRLKLSEGNMEFPDQNVNRYAIEKFDRGTFEIECLRERVGMNESFSTCAL